MVCFEVEISLAIRDRASPAALESRVHHLAHHCNADLKRVSQTENTIEYSLRLCDEDAKTLLRDFPTPFNVKKIILLHPGSILYLHRNHHEPPRIPLLKDVYWLAKSTERWRVLEMSS